MSNISSKNLNIKAIFDTMDYGPVSEGRSLAEAWISEHSELLGPYIHGKLSPATDNTECVQPGPKLGVFLKLNEKIDSSAALNSATSAAIKWAQLDGHARAIILYNIARQLQKHVALITQLEALTCGVQVRDPRENDVPGLIRTFYYYAGWSQLADSDLTAWKPYGLMAGVSSSSSSLYSLGLMVAPALASGNTVILLPHVSNSFTALLLAQVFSASGLPPGVFNVVPWEYDNTNQYPILASKDVMKVSIIGSAPFGRSVLQSTSPNLQQEFTLLLSGCVPMIVLESADLDAVVDCSMDAAWSNQGRDPWALRLVVVHEAVIEPFKIKLTERILGLKVGGAFDKMADVAGCMTANTAMSESLQKILLLDPSAEIVKPTSAVVPGEWAPTVIFSAAPPSIAVLSSAEECPVVHVVGVRSAKEAVNMAKHCGSGVAASVWTENNAQAWEAATSLLVGTVWINSHGIVDASIPISGRGCGGRGTFSGKEGLMECLIPATETGSPNEYCYNSTKASLLPVSSPVTSLKDPAAVDLTYKLFYGGGQKRPDSNSSRTLLDFEGKPLAIIPEASRKDVRNAVEAAAKAQPGWWKRGSHNRAQILYNLAEKLQSRHTHFARHLQIVYQLKDAVRTSQEVDECVRLLFHFAALCDKVLGSYGTSPLPGFAVTVTREPRGVVAILAAAGRGRALADVVTLVAAALAYGNTCVVAARPDCPTPALELAQILEASEVPAGVVNILSGETCALSPPIAGHMEVDALWCVGLEQDTISQVKTDSAKSNMKAIWNQDHMADPSSSSQRQVFEKHASHCKAVWIPTVASFGN